MYVLHNSLQNTFNITMSKISECSYNDYLAQIPSTAQK